jgi:hypothetical protein
VIALLLLSCGQERTLICMEGHSLGRDDVCYPDDTGAPDASLDDSRYTALDAPRLLRRMSLDLRGVLPSVAALDAVEADPAQLTAYRDDWLGDPRLEDRLVLLLAERWHTRIDEFLIFYLEYQELSGDSESEYPFERAVGEEPLRLMAHVAVNDLPWTDIVTADYTVANPLLADIWPLDHPGGEGWAVSHYTDERPAAGVLSTNGLWWRYYSTVTNYNRARVAAITRLLICEDYATRSISFSESGALSDGAALEDAIRESPYCMGCHAAIDPIAVTLFGFWPANEYNIHEVDTYHPEREALGAELLGVEAEWYGDPVYGLNELGQHIAADPRFSRCAVQSMAELLWRRPAGVADFDRIEVLRQAFTDADQRMLPLLAAITDDAVYQAGEVEDGSEVTTRMLSPDQLSTAIADLTGFAWTWAGFDQMDNDTYGYRALAGGVDGAYITTAQAAPGMTWALVVQRLAEAATSHDLRDGLAGSVLLDGIDEDARPGDPVFDALLDQLHWRLYATRPDASWRAGISAVWESVSAAEGAAEAWRAVVVAMLRDPAFVGY